MDVNLAYSRKELEANLLVIKSGNYNILNIFSIWEWSSHIITDAFLIRIKPLRINT